MDTWTPASPWVLQVPSGQVTELRVECLIGLLSRVSLEVALRNQAASRKEVAPAQSQHPFPTPKPKQEARRVILRVSWPLMPPKHSSGGVKCFFAALGAVLGPEIVGFKGGDAGLRQKWVRYILYMM